MQTYQPQKAPPIAEVQLPPASPESLSLARQALALQDTKARTLAAWQPWLDRESAQLVEVDDAQSGQHALDALRMALAEDG